MSSFEGDPKIILTEDGAELVYNDGQPVMDQGLENSALISLFTLPGWIGNTLLNEDEKIGSDFEVTARGTLTLSKLADIENAAFRALNTSFQKVTESSAQVNNPIGNQLDMLVRISPPGQDVDLLLTSKNGLNWRSQALDPANKRVS
jgi:hypothetical protein